MKSISRSINKYLLISIIIFFGIFSLAKSSRAANYCMTPTGAGDYSGADWNNAMKWDTGANQSPFSRGTAGNTYYLADGTYEGRVLSTAADSTKIITIKKATVSSHATETGWSSSMGDGVATFTSYAPTTNGVFWITTPYWVIDGVTGGGPGSWTSGHGFWLDLTSATGIGQGFYIYADYVTIRHTKISWPDRDSETYMSANSVSVGVESYGAWTGTTLQYLYILETPGGPIRQLGGTDMLIEYCLLDGNHSDAARHASGIIIGDGNSLNGTIRYNWLKNMEGSYAIGFYGWGPNGTLYTTHDGWKIYGNLVTWDASSTKTGTCGLIQNNSDCITKNFRVFNNTFADIRTTTPREDAGISLSPYTCPTQCPGNLIYNNIDYNFAQSYPLGSYSTVYNVAGSYCTSGATSDMKGLIIRQPYDCDYPDPSYARDPFVNSSYPTVDYSLAAHEDAGYNVCTGLVTCDSTNTYDKDMLSNTRTNWRRGAYEYVQAGDATPPAAPQGLSVN